jgi:hypothetical protein
LQPNEFNVVYKTEDNEEIFLVFVKEPAVNQIDLAKLGDFFERLQGDVPFDVVTVLDIILRHMPSMR